MKEIADVDFLRQRSIEIDQLVKRFGHRTVNLIHNPNSLVRNPFNGGPMGNEGIWVIPVDANSAALMDDDLSKGENVRVYLCNDLIGTPFITWGNLCFGAEVIAITNGENRPFARVEDQTEKETNAENALLLSQYFSNIPNAKAIKV